MLFQCSNKYDEGSIYISGTRETFNLFKGALVEHKTESAAYGTLELGKITITITRELDEEDKV